MEEALRRCVEFNAALDVDRKQRGPFYYDRHTSSTQMVAQRVLKDVVLDKSLVQTEALRKLARDEEDYAAWYLSTNRNEQPMGRGLKCGRCGLWAKANSMCACQICKAAYHPSCSTPAQKRVPQGTYLCHKCTLCKTCGATESERWFADFQMCLACHQRQRRGEHCPVCLLPDLPEEAAVRCRECSKWVHANGKCAVVSQELWDRLQSGEESLTCSRCVAKAAGASEELAVLRKQLLPQMERFRPREQQQCPEEGCGQRFGSRAELAAHRAAEHEKRSRRGRRTYGEDGEDDEDEDEGGDASDEEFEDMIEEMQNEPYKRRRRSSRR